MAWKHTVDELASNELLMAGMGDSDTASPDVWVTVYANRFIWLRTTHEEIRITPTQARELAALLIEAATIVEQEDGI